ncbi:PAS domain-containing protein [Pelagibius marinus]|uniref:PAS domain-containing protein n=1 Tax=Pelagibius marinus TaxID=2762760 RepID=UPI001873036D|nr:PAS domain-containing protein [Pelagibius marinus]
MARSEGADGPVKIPSRRVDELNSPRLRETFAIWQEKCGGPDRLPDADDFDILDYRPAVGNLNLVAVERDPLDFVFRVHSANGATYVGRDLTGRSIEDYPNPEYRGFVREVFTRATLSKQPVVLIEELLTADSRRMSWEGVVMPLQDGDGEISRLIVAFEILN